MAFFVWCEIVCVECATTVAGEWTSDRPNRRYMAKEAKRHGWRQVGDGEWACPRCKKKLLRLAS